MNGTCQYEEYLLHKSNIVLNVYYVSCGLFYHVSYCQSAILGLSIMLPNE